jgi:hypothetical protein
LFDGETNFRLNTNYLEYLFKFQCLRKEELEGADGREIAPLEESRLNGMSVSFDGLSFLSPLAESDILGNVRQ